jgi:hypothetical protein
MNLVVAARHETPVMRFVVEGPWRSGDALKLAYFIKAAVARAREENILVDVRRVKTPPGEQGKFLICDRLRRAMNAHVRIGLVGDLDLVGTDAVPRHDHHACVAVFEAERDALTWLCGDARVAP